MIQPSPRLIVLAPDGATRMRKMLDLIANRNSLVSQLTGRELEMEQE
jgi:hypothetical protein